MVAGRREPAIGRQVGGAARRPRADHRGLRAYHDRAITAAVGGNRAHPTGYMALSIGE